MKRKAFQTVVDYINVQSDYLYEFMNDKTVNDKDRIKFKEDLTDLCEFMQAAKAKGFNADNSCYPLAKKLEVLNGKTTKD